MKKNLFFITCLIGSQSLLAAPITPDEALARLSDGEVPARVHAAAGALRLARTVKTAAGNPAVYVFARQNGETLFVSADDLARPLLGFTESAPGGELPPQLEWWLSEYAREIEGARPVKAAPQTPGAPKPDYMGITREAIAPMLTTRWNQDEPYNLLCPEVDGSRCYTGCVATAAAQVMYYFKYPATGTGTISYVCNEGGTGVGQYHGTLSLDFSSVTFDWENMLATYDRRDTTEPQRNAVATLMMAVGYASAMGYGTQSSGAYTGTCVEGMKQYLGYNEKASTITRKFFSRSAWESLIYRNLQEVGPVLYRGSGLSGGAHAFVCDGYSDGFFHFNWGWGGAYDGMFSLSALSPESGGIGANSSSDYSFDQSAYINITRPDGRTIDTEEPAIMGYGNLSGSIEDDYLKLSARRVLYNHTGESLTILPAVRLTDAQDRSYIVELSGGAPTLNPGYGFTDLYFRLPDDLADGTYRVTLEWSEGGDAFVPVPRETGCTDFVTLRVSGGTCSIENPAAPVYTFSDVELLSPLYLSSDFKMAFTVSNNSETEIATGVQPWLYQRPEGATPQYIFTTDRLAMCQGVFLDLMPGESARINNVFSMSPLISSLAAPVQAYLALVNPTDMSVIYEMPVTLNPAIEKCSPVLDALIFDGDAANADPDDLRFKVKLTNKAGMLAAPVTIGLYTVRGNVMDALESPTVFAEAGETVEVEVHGKTDMLQPDTDYMAYVLYRDPKSGQYAFMEPTEPLTFHVSKNYTGISTTETREDVCVSLLGGEVRISAPSGVGAADFYSADGRLLRHVMCGGISETSVALPGDTRGIIICRVTLADGSSIIKKIAL